MDQLPCDRNVNASNPHFEENYWFQTDAVCIAIVGRNTACLAYPLPAFNWLDSVMFLVVVAIYVMLFAVGPES